MSDKIVLTPYDYEKLQKLYRVSIETLKENEGTTIAIDRAHEYLLEYQKHLGIKYGFDPSTCEIHGGVVVEQRGEKNA